MRISVCISSYGDESWASLARERALPSAEAQGDWVHEILIDHLPKGTVSSCRNANAERASGDWLCFLDADDELDRLFCQAMQRAIRRHARSSTSLLLTPAVAYVRNGHRQRPRFWPVVPLDTANWLILGTLVRRELFFSVGGFMDYGDPPGSNAFEDWALWARCHKAGAQVVKVPRAIYVAHYHDDSRHHSADHRTRQGWHREIGRDLFPDIFHEHWPGTRP